MEAGLTGHTGENVARIVEEENRYGAGLALNQLLNTKGGSVKERMSIFGQRATTFSVRNCRKR